jgi:hypothetical protein
MKRKSTYPAAPGGIDLAMTRMKFFPPVKPNQGDAYVFAT